MSFILETPITKLETSSIKWCIRVRAQALWKGITRETKEFRGINVLFVDDCRSRIHGFISAKLAPMFEKELVEGDIYEISNFIVQEYSGMEFNRCVRFDKHIFFAHYTKVQKSLSNVLTIPKIAVDLFSIEDLKSLEEDKRFLCDVCGVLQDPSDLRDYINDNEEPKMQKKFFLADGSSSVSVTLFDDLAKTFEQAINGTGTKNTIVILTSVKIGRFQGELNLTNYPATRFYLNADHNAVKNLRRRWSTRTIVEKEIVVTQLPKVILEEMCIEDIKNLKDESKVVCRVIVKKIKEDLKWYFYLCIPCKVELHLIDGRYECPKCARIYPWPQKRFRVCVLCCDKTGVIALILGDREIRRLTGKTVFHVDLDQTEEEDGKFPTSLKSILNKEFVFTVSVNGENVNQESEIYEVCDITIPADDNLKTLTDVQQLSEEPEDDHIDESQYVDLNTQNSETIAEKKKRTGAKRLMKLNQAGENVSNKSSLNKLQNIKIKKEKILLNDKKKIKSIGKKQLEPSKRGRKLILDVFTESEEEDMTLTNYQIKTKKQGKEPMQ